MLDRITEEVKLLRSKLHAVPELSFAEKQSKALLIDFISSKTNLEILDYGCWFCALYKGDCSEPPVAFRADFDAVAGKDGCPGHFCGHDGHAAILAGFGLYLDTVKPSGSYCLVFQPAEETGEGALVCRDKLCEMNISAIYAFHNIPGFKQNSILIREHTFACASTGLEIKITGSPSHAANPDAGKNPSDIIAKLILLKNEIFSRQHKGLVLVTVIGIDAGSSSYGVSASSGTLRLTLRAEYNDEFNGLIDEYSRCAIEWSEAENMTCTLRRIEAFASTENDMDCVSNIIAAAKLAGKELIYPGVPFRWSEDFGFYLEKLNGAYFGIGAGESHPSLHTENYDFPDPIIKTALEIYSNMIT